ncbi:MAG: DUF3596 domain-containing protein [Cyanobacteria bacterium CRU_2_1]|nr:DUF3596 domain-containing protein [Cyanobacteria bacterium CRU_2_1]
MFSKTATGKASKGSVSVINSNDRLQLRFRVQGKRYYLSTGLADTLANRKLAQLKASEIEKDILYERFDPTLERYKAGSALSTVTPITPIAKAKPQLDELWAKYSEFKKPQISPSTYAKDYIKCRNHISRLPSCSLDEALLICDYLLENLTLDAAKRCLNYLKSCCTWAVEDGLIDVNPFMSMKIKAPKGLSEDEDVNPFTKEERDRIIQAFETDRYYRHYTDYVRFLFFTGCRPSEAIALKWKHITSNAVKFRESVVISEDGLVRKEGLKTQKRRDFPITPELQAILDAIKPAQVNPGASLFKSPRGKFVDQHNFLNRAWKAILKKCGIEYRKSYQTRHTFISLCIEAGINSTAIGRWTGTSAKMIDKHYGAWGCNR